MDRATTPFLMLFVVLAAPVHSQTLGSAAPARHSVRNVKNPFARVVVVPLEFSSTGPAGSYSRIAGTLTIQPLIPFLLGPKWDLITQTTIPLLSQPDLSSRRNRSWGIGDIGTNLYFTPDNAGRVHWAVGPGFLFPAASNPDVGTGKWGLGPTAALVAEPGKWTLGVQALNLKSVAGGSARSDFHYLALNWQVTHNFHSHWYVTSSPAAVADWKASAGERWLVPVGLGLGRVFGLGRRQVSTEVSAYYSLAHPLTQPYPKWVFALEVAFAQTDRP
jgi:hypothetical protein